MPPQEGDMTGRPILTTVFALGALIVVALSAEAAVSGDAPSLFERAACHVIAVVHGAFH
jgi:hypothetical protein